MADRLIMRILSSRAKRGIPDTLEKKSRGDSSASLGMACFSNQTSSKYFPGNSAELASTGDSVFGKMEINVGGGK
jgi:hypothetical protein